MNAAQAERFDAECLLRPGNTNCGGCGMSNGLTMLGRALAGERYALVIPACCGIVTAGAYPTTAYNVPVVASTFASAAAFASGVMAVNDLNPESDGTSRHVICWAGDGGTYDIGFQCLSSAAERNEDFIYFCLDNEGYMNTGAQKSSSTPHFAKTGSTPAGKVSRKKNLIEIMAAHEVPYAANACAGYLPDLMRKVEKARSIRGTRIISLLTSYLSMKNSEMSFVRMRERASCAPGPATSS